MRYLLLFTLLAALAALPAMAQDAVVLVGDTGVTTALEVKASSGFVVRGGVVHHTAESDDGAYEAGWLLGAGWRFQGDKPVTLDLAYDAERMQPHLADMEGSMDSRVRVGIGYRATKRATAVVEFSRSLFNGTNYDRFMVGVRLGR